MDPIVTRLRPSYYVRIGILAVFMIGPGLLLLLFGRQFDNYRLAGLVPIVLWLYMYVFEYFRGARQLDDTGVTRRDGRRFEWIELKDTRFQRPRLPSGELGAVSNVDLLFPRGKVRVFPFTLRNAGEVFAFLERLKPPVKQAEKLLKGDG